MAMNADRHLGLPVNGDTEERANSHDVALHWSPTRKRFANTE